MTVLYFVETICIFLFLFAPALTPLLRGRKSSISFCNLHQLEGLKGARYLTLETADVMSDIVEGSGEYKHPLLALMMTKKS